MYIADLYNMTMFTPL